MCECTHLLRARFAHALLGAPPLLRDFVVHGFGECSEVERGRIIIIGESVEDEEEKHESLGEPAPADAPPDERHGGVRHITLPHGGVRLEVLRVRLGGAE